MRMTEKGRPLICAAGALLVSMVAVQAASAAQITVFRGSDTIVVDTNAPHQGPHVLRGGMGPKTPKKKEPVEVRQTVNVSPSGIVGSGGTVWLRTEDGLVACSLRGNGYVGQRVIRCYGQ